MGQIEIIHLRTSGESPAVLCQRIRESVRTEAGGTEPLVIYRREGLESDIAIHIRRDEPSTKKGPSALGLRLASALRSFGLVEHTVWEELA